MNLEELLQEAKNGNMVAQYDLAEYYGKLLKETEDEEEIYKYSLDAMLWLKKSAQQGYGPAMEAVSELEVRPSAPAREAAEVPEQEPAPAPGADDETAAAVAAAVMESTSNISEPSGDTREVPSAAVSAAVPPAEEKKPEERSRAVTSTRQVSSAPRQKERFFSSTTNIVVFCMLIISLLLNILLLIFLFRMNRERNTVPPAPTPSAVAEVTPSARPTPTPKPTPTATPEPTPTATPEPTPTAEPHWLDLSKYPDLELKPTEDQLYDDYVYYVVTADDTLNMRAGPDTRYERITTIPGMARVGAVANYGGWYLVQYGDDLGWVSGNYLTSNLNYQRPVQATASSGDLQTW